MKAILVIDMPNWNGCRNCQFNIGGELCTARDYEDGEDGCPLKPMPEKRLLPVLQSIDYEYGYIDGWNACLKEIEK